MRVGSLVLGGIGGMHFYILRLVTACIRACVSSKLHLELFNCIDSIHMMSRDLGVSF